MNDFFLKKTVEMIFTIKCVGNDFTIVDDLTIKEFGKILQKEFN